MLAQMISNVHFWRIGWLERSSGGCMAEDADLSLSEATLSCASSSAGGDSMTWDGSMIEALTR